MVILDAPGDSSRISVEEGLKGAVWLEGEASGTKLRLNVYLGWLFERGGGMEIGVTPGHSCALGPPTFLLLWITPANRDGFARAPSSTLLFLCPLPALRPLLIPYVALCPISSIPAPLPFLSSLTLFQNLSSFYLNLVMTSLEGRNAQGTAINPELWRKSQG